MKQLQPDYNARDYNKTATITLLPPANNAGNTLSPTLLTKLPPRGEKEVVIKKKRPRREGSLAKIA